MKYIKLFENYPSPKGFTPNSIEDNINDIFVELKDCGYIIGYQRFNEIGDSVSVTIRKDAFNTSDIKEYVMMFIDYMTDEFGEQRVLYRGRTTAYEADDTFYANGILVTTYEYPDDIELTALKIDVNTKK